ncbi:hypothetical protein M9H77_25028 [Catharanthus roseus]|uniref:Uncharacterized protein n=1 Tax=Catharanthus roseus TaxID=4058 RepID=A0ACC0A763_CATRO|nr:hypothetical protein M9H77_25028 [Catharanthus roseus]
MSVPKIETDMLDVKFDFVMWRRKMKVVLVQNKIAPAICSPEEYPESWKGEILKEKLGDAHSCHTLDDLSLFDVKKALKSKDLDLQKENKSHGEIFLCEEGLTGENLLVIVLKVVPNQERKESKIFLLWERGPYEK